MTVILFNNFCFHSNPRDKLITTLQKLSQDAVFDQLQETIKIIIDLLQASKTNHKRLDDYDRSFLRNEITLISQLFPYDETEKKKYVGVTKDRLNLIIKFIQEYWKQF